MFYYLHLLRHDPKYTLWEVIAYHYRFLSSRAYQNRYMVLGITLGVPAFISWVVDLEVLGLGSWGAGSRVPGPFFRLCLTEQLLFLHSCEWLLLIIYLINACDQKIRLVKNQIITHHTLYSGVKFKETRLVKLLPCFFKWL